MEARHQQKPGRRRSVLYFGVYHLALRQKKMTNFIHDRVKAIGHDTPKSLQHEYFHDEEFIGTRITIGATSAELRSNYSFWPGRVYARQWKFRADNPTLPKPESTANVELGGLSDEAAGKKFLFHLSTENDDCWQTDV